MKNPFDEKPATRDEHFLNTTPGRIWSETIDDQETAQSGCNATFRLGGFA